MPGSVTIALDSAPLAKDPHWPADYDGRFISAAVVRPLLAPDSSGETSESAAGVEYRERDDRWRVYLDTSLRWSDGVRLTSVHAAASARRVADRSRSAVFGLLHGSEAVRVVDGSCVEYRFARPISFGQAVFTLPQLAPSRTAQARIRAPSSGDLSLGAFQVKETENQRIRLTRNHFNDAASPAAPDSLEFRIFPRLPDALENYAQGAVDISPVTSLGESELAVIRAQSNVVSRDIPIFGCLEFGRGAPGLAGRPDLRRAIGAALDRSAIVRTYPNLVRPFWSQSTVWSPQTEDSPGQIEEPSPAQIDEIRQALGGNIEIPHADFTPNADIVSKICQQLGTVFGITASGRALGYRHYVRTVLSGDYPLLYTLTVADFCHPAALLLPWRTGSPDARRSGFASAGLDQRIDEAAAAFDGQDRLWRVADQYWLELMPRIPVVQVRGNCGYSNRVSGVQLTSCGHLNFDRLAVNPIEVAPIGPHRNEAAR